MRQSAFTILTPIATGEVGNLVRLLDAIGDDVAGDGHFRFTELEDLHYASLFVVDVGTMDPYLVFEGNVDGRAGAFLDHLLEVASEGVDRVYGHCAGYPPVGAEGRSAALRYLTRHDIGADTFYVNRPGRTVKDIRSEQRLRDHIERFLDDHDGALRSQEAGAVRRSIGASLTDDLGWARTPAPTPFVVRHTIDARYVVLLLLTPALATVLGLVKVAVGPSSTRRQARLSRVALAAVAGLGARAVQQLRAAEADDERRDRRRDPDWQSAYAAWISNEHAIGDREDHQGQNHMVSVTRVNPGWFRLVILRVVLRVLNVIAMVTTNRGTLGGITSIHFARWVVTPDRSLMFLSNFDGSWESYLNDFIDLAAPGLTAVWSNTENEVGFPTTRWLVGGGAREAARFKAYARSSMVRTNVWYSAYPDISAVDIGNNMQLRDDLFAPLDPSATEAWLRRL